MFKILFGYFLIIHVIGDFYLQSDKIAKKKRTSFKYVLLHSLIYFAAALILSLFFWSTPIFIAATALSLSHFLIDSIKFILFKYLKNGKSFEFYIADQALHLIFIAGIASIFIYGSYEFKTLPQISEFLKTISAEPKEILKWIGLALLVFKPANITIKHLIYKYRTTDLATEIAADNTIKAGAFIGTLERITILLLMSVGQYSAIGLVLTAKSIARYNKISEDRQFAEYYLIGTLLSTLYAIIIFFVFV